MRGGGAEKVALNLYSYFSSNKFQTELIVLQKEGAYLEQINSENIRFLEKQRSRYALADLVRIIKLNSDAYFLSTKRDINIVMGIAKFLSLRWKLKLFFREANPIIIKKLSLNEMLNLLVMKISYFFANHIISNSHGTRKTLLKYSICNPAKITVIGNPVIFKKDIKNFPFQSFEPSRNENIIIAAGRLEPQKNFQLAIDILEQLNIKSSKKNFKLVIYGDGSEREKLQNHIKTKRLQDHVLMPGFNQNLISEMMSSSLFLLTSHFEGFGNVIIEALFSGIPVCAKYSDGGVVDILKNNKFFKVIDSANNDPEEFAETISSLMKSKLTVHDRNEIRKISLKYTVENIGNQYLSLMSSL